MKIRFNPDADEFGSPAIPKHGLTQARYNMPALPTSDGGWNQLAQLVMEAEISDEIAEAQGRFKSESSAMLGLSNRIGTTIMDLLDIKEMIPTDQWTAKKMERLVRLEQIRTRTSNWDELEFLTLQKLQESVERGLISTTTELLAIAVAANKAGRTGVNMSDRGGVNIQINNVGSANPNGDLPGPGDIGKIELSLSRRTLAQLQGDPAKQSDGKYLDSIEMLTAKDIPGLSQVNQEDEAK